MYMKCTCMCALCTVHKKGSNDSRDKPGFETIFVVIFDPLTCFCWLGLYWRTQAAAHKENESYGQGPAL